MRYIFRFLMLLVLVAGVAVLAYAFVGDMSAERSTVETPVTLEVD